MISVKQVSSWEKIWPAMFVLSDVLIVPMQILVKNASFAICSSTQPTMNVSYAM